MKTSNTISYLKTLIQEEAASQLAEAKYGVTGQGDKCKCGTEGCGGCPSLEEGARPGEISAEDLTAAITLAIDEVFQERRPSRESAQAAYASIAESIDTIFRESYAASARAAKMMGAEDGFEPLDEAAIKKIIEEEVCAALNLSEESIKDKEFKIDVKHCVENEGKGCRQDTDDFWKAVKKAMASEGLFDQTVAKVKTRGAKIDDMFKKSGAYTSQRGMKRESQQGVNKLTEATPGAITEDIWNKLEKIYYAVASANSQVPHMVMKRVKKQVAGAKKAKSKSDSYKKLIERISKRYPAFKKVAAAAGLPMVR